jgi:alanyl-tRNA synthetase
VNSLEIRQRYIDFFKKNGHHHIPSSTLIPENDPTTLFTSSGMQPLLKYFLGETHPNGNRIVNSQICLRAHGFMDDLLEVGDNRHTSFFEMLGNWSFGDYFKKEQIPFFYDFLTKELGIDPKKLYVTCFIGDTDNNIAKDTEAVEIWKKLFLADGIDAEVSEFSSMEEAENTGMSNSRISLYPSKKNWWSRNGVPSNMPEGDIGGPDTEVFFDFGFTHNEKFGKYCHPNCDCGRFLEIGNSVFTQYQKQAGKFIELPSKNVDFGGGLERMVAVKNNTDDVFETDLYQSIIAKLEELLGISYSENKPLFRIIADHIKSSTFLINFGVTPSNKLQGYVLRKFIRRAAVKIFLFNPELDFSTILSKVPASVIKTYAGISSDFGFSLNAEKEELFSKVVFEEAENFKKVLKNGMKVVEKTSLDKVDSKFVFDLYQNLGFPFEVSYDIYQSKGLNLSQEEFNSEFSKHRNISK